MYISISYLYSTWHSRCLHVFFTSHLMMTHHPYHSMLLNITLYRPATSNIGIHCMKHPKSTLPPKGRGEWRIQKKSLKSQPSVIRIESMNQPHFGHHKSNYICSNPLGIGEFFMSNILGLKILQFSPKDRLSTATCTKDRIACHRINCKQTGGC